MPMAEINGITLNYRIDGEDGAASTVVLINGLADDIEFLGLPGAGLCRGRLPGAVD